MNENVTIRVGIRIEFMSLFAYFYNLNYIETIKYIVIYNGIRVYLIKPFFLITIVLNDENV